MKEYIEKEMLYKEVAELEELARNRVLDTPTNSPAYARYVAQLNERTELKRKIYDFPAADVAEVRHGEWIPVDEKRDAFDCSECDAMVSRMMNYCPRCGARMKGEGENAVD